MWLMVEWLLISGILLGCSRLKQADSRLVATTAHHGVSDQRLNGPVRYLLEPDCTASGLCIKLIGLYPLVLLDSCKEKVRRYTLGGGPPRCCSQASEDKTGEQYRK